MKDDVALITGGATGIGLGIARALIEAGAKVVLSSRNEEKLQEAAQQLGSQAAYRVFDVTDFAQTESFVAGVEAEVGPISVLINNAGNHLKKPSEQVSTDEFQAVLDVHILGAHRLTTAVGKRMMVRGGGSILFIASMASLFGLPNVLAYSAAKAGYLGMTRALATEWGGKGIRVNAIAPGWIESDMTRRALGSDPERHAKILARTPLGRLGEAEDIGWAAAFLSSSAARFITGVCLPVDGGAAIGF